MLALVVATALISQPDTDGTPADMIPLTVGDDVCALMGGGRCGVIERRRVRGVGEVALYRAREADTTTYVIVVTDAGGDRTASMPLAVGLQTKLCAGGEEPLRQHVRLRRVVVDGVPSVALDVRFAVRSNVVDGAYCKVREHRIWHDEVLLVVGANGRCLELAPGYFSYCPARLSRRGIARTCDGRRALGWTP